MTLKKLNKFFNKIDHILILMHANPDCDAVGAAYALLINFIREGKKAYVGVERKLNEKYSFFVEEEYLNEYFLTKEQLSHRKIEWVVCVDASDPNMLGDFQSYIKKEKVIVIDHHHTFTPFGKINLNFPEKSATCEIIYDLFKGKMINKSMAKGIYAGIVYDTGSFRYSSTTPELLKKIAHILEQFPLDTHWVFSNVFENETILRKKLVAKIVETIETYYNNEIVISFLNKKFIYELNIDESETHDLVYVGNSIKGCQFSIFIKEKEDGVYFSFRARNDFDVASLAKEWGGGGHQKASGLKLANMNLSKVKETLIPIFIKKYKEWREQ